MFYAWKLNFILLSHFLANIGKGTFHFQANINVETTLDFRHWIDVILSVLFRGWFVNVETTAINIRDKHTLFHQRWIDINLSTLFQHCFVNVDKCTSAQLSFLSKYQSWNNVDERWWSTLFQRWCVCWIGSCQIPMIPVFWKNNHRL